MGVADRGAPGRDPDRTERHRPEADDRSEEGGPVGTEAIDTLPGLRAELADLRAEIDELRSDLGALRESLGE